MKSKEIKTAIKKGEEQRIRINNEERCAKEVNEVLKKYNCATDIQFVKDVVLGNPVLKYETKIVSIK